MTRPDQQAAPRTEADWTAKRAALAERWAGKGLSPMTEFEMAAAVYRDSLVVGLDALGNIDAYDRRGLLNLVAELLDRAEARSLVPTQEPLREALLRMINETYETHHTPSSESGPEEWDYTLTEPTIEAVEQALQALRAASPAPSASGDLRAALEAIVDWDQRGREVPEGPEASTGEVERWWLEQDRLYNEAIAKARAALLSAEGAESR